ncbi:hypothetical protein Tfer_2859 [Thermincola ferriacetica]|uniref:L-2-amino-thiazoline-4-carboxylic acid hydrolase n=1 Tax=Thermincola ferriacetica TaxID=281456 RepID=A0A0L6VZ51_9FIRM|nr:L-2-amino-thiazoline-4-carboxylic acid hydrolase [Thermincola ferriacetica]KNZ68607.1 hypothetical protein Tfer_2859 [Thermincola ferriacetica]
MEDKVTGEELRDAVRAAIEDRAVWLYLILKELQGGKEITEVPAVSEAIFKFGRQKGEQMPPADNPGDWARSLITPVGSMVFEQKLVEESDNRAVIEFSYCPLVEAWKKQGASDKEVAALCKMARCGDHGRIASFPFKLTFEKLLAEGDKVCRLLVEREDIRQE